VKHAWAGAWVNSLFRSEGAGVASELIREAVAATRSLWNPPPLGIVSFVDPKHVKPTMVRGSRSTGTATSRRAWKHVGFTKGGLWAWQQLPHEMPEAEQLPILEAAASVVPNVNAA
jgi:hypothetical protein